MRARSWMAVLLCLGFGAALSAQDAAAVLAFDDGRSLLPFARAEAGKWIPVGDPGSAWPRRWTRWTREGAPAAVSITAAPAGSCGAWPRLRQDGPANSSPGAARPGPPSLATAGEPTVHRVAAIEAGTPEWGRLVPQIRRLFEAREGELRLAPRQIARAPIAIDALYAASGEGAGVYYFEASRTVPDDPADVAADDPRGALRVTVNGWLRTMGEGSESLGARADLRWEQLDRADRAPARAPDLTPVGVVAHRGQRIWVMRAGGSPGQLSLYETSGPRVLLLLRVPEPSC